MGRGKIVIDEKFCKGCNLCIEFCPKKLIETSTHLNINSYYPAKFIDNGECNGCAICATVCPEVAIEVYREKVKK
jgi:2-oxoglutarate ferredoxin oxidoreductase subunit delta